jgi:hypothetical protein
VGSTLVRITVGFFGNDDMDIDRNDSALCLCVPLIENVRLT